MRLLDTLRKMVGDARSTRHLAERQLLLSARLLGDRNRERSPIRDLSEVEFSAFSQWGEDGIIDWLVERLPGVEPSFVEFGVEDYRECNTRYLLMRRNWRGLVMDGSAAHVAAIRAQGIYWRHDLTALHAFVTRENIDGLLEGAGVSGPVGLLSIDIDGNDYWVWEAMDAITPAIVVCEYNAVFGDMERISVPYRHDFDRTRAHPSNLFFGASLPALIALGERKGYTFVGTGSSGGNAFFVRSDRAAAVLESLEEVRGHPSRFREARGPEGALVFARGRERLELIRDMEVFDLARNDLVPLGDYDRLYSEAWRAGG